jgi:hypothetical protein
MLRVHADPQANLPGLNGQGGVLGEDCRRTIVEGFDAVVDDFGAGIIFSIFGYPGNPP